MNQQSFPIASYCSSPSWGGLEMNVVRFLRWMAERGWETILYGHPDTRMYREAEGSGILVRPVISRMQAGDLVNARRLARHLKQDQVKALIVHQSRDFFLTAMAKRFAPTTKLISSQHMHIGGTKKDIYHRWLYNHFDVWVTPVSWLAERVFEKTHLPRERVRIIPRGIILGDFTANRPDKTEARKCFDLPVDADIIGVIGRLDPKKGQDVVVRALAKLHASGLRPHLLLVGDKTFNEADQYATDLAKLIERENLTEYVHLRSHRSEVALAYATLDLFVMASRSECYGMVTLEARCFGLPVVGTRNGGTISLIDHERTGLMVTPGDVDEFAAAISRMLGDSELAKRLAGTSEREAKATFSHTTQCEQWEELLGSL